MSGKGKKGQAEAAAAAIPVPIDLEVIRKEERNKILEEMRKEKAAEEKQREATLANAAEEMIQRQIAASRAEAAQQEAARERERAIQAIRRLQQEERDQLNSTSGGFQHRGSGGSGSKRDRLPDSPRSVAREEEYRKPKRSMQDKLRTLTAAAASDSSGGRMSVLTAEDVEMMFRQRITNADLPAGRSAEMRRLAGAMWVGAYMYEAERDDNPSLRCEAMEFILRFLETCVIQLSIFSNEKSGMNLYEKIARLEGALIETAAETGEVLGDKVRAWLPVPEISMGLRLGRQY